MSEYPGERSQIRIQLETGLRETLDEIRETESVARVLKKRSQRLEQQLEEFTHHLPQDDSLHAALLSANMERVKEFARKLTNVGRDIDRANARLNLLKRKALRIRKRLSRL